MIKHLRLFLLVTLLIAPATLYSTPLPQSADDIKVSGWASPDKTRRGRSVQANVVMEIPAGLHVQSSRPLDKFLVATKLNVEAPAGVKVSAPIYPRAVMRNLKFSKGKVAVYEGRAPIRFNVTIPANYNGNSAEIKGRLRFQACNDESCFPPVTREVKVWVNVE
jgi:thioredoxin:protein disulfide reductase